MWGTGGREACPDVSHQHSAFERAIFSSTETRRKYFFTENIDRYELLFGDFDLGLGPRIFKGERAKHTLADVGYECRAETGEAGAAFVADAGVDDAG